MDEVEQLLEQAWQLAVKIERPQVRASRYTEIAEVYLQAGNKTQGLAVLSEALKTADLLKQPDEKAKLLAWLGRLYVVADDPDRAREQFSRAILLSRATETASQKTSALYSIACENTDAGRHPEAARVLSELQEIVLDPENHLDIACELINIAELFFDIDSIEEAKDSLEQVLAISLELKDNWFKAERLLEAAEIYSEMGENEKVKTILELIASTINQIEEINRPGLLFRIFDIYFTVGDKVQALNTLIEALAIINQHPEAPSSPQDLIEIANDYARLGDTAASQRILVQAQRLIDKIDMIKEKVYNLIGLTSAFNKMGQRDLGLEFANRALDLIGAISNKKSIPFLLGSIAVVYAELKDRDHSSEVVARILHTLQEIPVKTSGLKVVVDDLSATGEIKLALQLADVIREPDAKADALTSLARSLIETNGDTYYPG